MENSNNAALVRAQLGHHFSWSKYIQREREWQHVTVSRRLLPASSGVEIRLFAADGLSKVIIVNKSSITKADLQTNLTQNLL
jgi:hypothetical protein